MDGALVHSDIIPVDNNMKIWQMKVTLKLNMFACVILTKDNLVKNNWHGSTKCFSFPHKETIKHLLFECKVTHSMWSTIHIASKVYPPRSVANIFGNWLHGEDNKFQTIIRVGEVAVIWPL